MTKIEELITSLQLHGDRFPWEKESCDRTISWIREHGESAFVKANLEWHITASLIVINEAKDKILLMLHKKLQLWIWFGGHCDWEIDIKSVAIREFHEESWIIEEPEIFPSIFHVDIHDIPLDMKWTPPHKHFDILFLATISEDIPLSRQESEVDDIGWFTLDEALEKNNEHLMQCAITKIRKLK